MVLASTLLLLGFVIAAIWIFVEFKRLKHKIFAIATIVLILFAYVSFTTSIKGNDLDLKNSQDMIKATRIYFSWLGNIFGNMKATTAYALKKDWNEYDQTILEKNVSLDLADLEKDLEKKE